jgi:hypothetical protein
MRPTILIGRNNLSGNNPIEIGNLKMLHGLDFSHNNFSGSIPDQVSELTNLEILDLSANRLFGQIPSSLSSLHFLSHFSVANNNLHGPILSGLSFKALMPLHMRVTLDFVARHFHMSVPILLETTNTFMMTTMGIEFHDFTLLWFLASLHVFGEFVVHWL